MLNRLIRTTSVTTLFSLTLRIHVALFACAISLVASAADIADTGVLARDLVYWLDDNRVLFAGFNSARAGQPPRGGRYRSVIYIWDEQKKQASIHAEIPEGDYVCFSDGFISYAIRRDGVRYIREGRLGSESEHKWDRAGFHRKIDRNEITCRDFDYGAADQIYPGFLLIPFREGDGYYGWKKEETRVGTNDKSLFYLEPGPDRKPHRLPIAGKDLRRVSYSQYLDAYVFESVPSQRDDKTVGAVWILDRNGATKKLIIPAGLWMGGSIWSVPAKTGIVMSSRALGLKSTHDVGHAGVYLVQESRVDRLMAGFPHRPAVSPNGCKVAVAINPMTTSQRQGTLHMVTLCKRGD